MKKNKQALNIIRVFGLILVCAVVWTAGAELLNAPQIRAFYGLTPAYQGISGLSGVTIAVLDEGFAGLEKSDLPASAELIGSYDEPGKQLPLRADDPHGLNMAQIAWAMSGFDPQGPKFLLLNANNISNLKRAVRYAIKRKVDIILYSMNWECCGNYDGGGFINELANEATRAGILWINAAGNYGGQVYDATTLSTVDRDLRFSSRISKHPVSITLSWNASSDDEKAGTSKDLDLYLYDPEGKVIAQSELNQVVGKDKLAETETLLPREKLSAKLQRSTADKPYRLRVVVKGGRVDRHDRVRIVILSERQPVQDGETGKELDPIDFIDGTKGREIMVPGDNPNVVTAGDLTRWSARGPTADGRLKPDVLMPLAEAPFSEGVSSDGSSNAAAYLAGIAAVLKASRPTLDRATLLRCTVPATVRNLSKVSLGLDTLMRPKTAPEPEIFKFRKEYPEITYALEQLTQTQVGQAILSPQKRWVLQLPMTPRKLSRLFPVLPANALTKDGVVEYEFYVYSTTVPGTKRIALAGAYRKRDSNEAYPWDVFGMSESRFVEIQFMGPRLASEPEFRLGEKWRKAADLAPYRLWRTPTPTELAAGCGQDD